MQQRDYLEIKARIFVEDGVLEGTTLTIEVNEKESQQFKISRNAEFPYRLKFNNEYKLTFSKPGLYSRIILISTQVPKTILDINSIFPPVEFQVNLFKEITGVDKSFSLRPYARIFYDKVIDDFSHELFVLDNLFAIQLDQALAKEKEINKEQKTLNRLELKELQEMQKEFDQLIKEADNFFNQKNYSEALAKYQDAVRLFPDRPYPQDRIREIQNLLDALKLAEQKKGEQEQLYKETIQQADVKFQNKQYSDALISYNQAIQYIPNDNYAQQRITEIGQILEREQLETKFTETLSRAEGFFGNKEYEQAITTFREAAAIQPNNPRPNARIEEINRILQQLSQQATAEQLYQKAIQDGDKLAAQQKYADAIVQYRKALEVKADDAIAQGKIQSAEATIQQAQNQQAYNTAIVAADKAFKAKDYPLAETEYRKALQYKANDPLAVQRINEIDQIMAQRAEAERVAKMEEQARLEAEKASREKYNQAIALADAGFGQKKYTEARGHYLTAMGVLPAEQYPKDKIREIDTIQEEMQKQAEAAKQQAARDSINKIRIQEYQSLVKQAEQLATARKYEDAISKYNEALIISAENKADIDSRVTRLRDQIRIAKKQQEDYRTAIRKADDFFNSGKYTEARPLYVDAGNAMPNEEYPKIQLRKIQEITDKKNAEYIAFIEKADEFFIREEWQSAKNNYSNALTIKTNDEHAKSRIRLADQKINEALAADAEKSRKQKEFNDLVSQANQLLAEGKLRDAQNLFQLAKQLNPNDTYPDQKIREIARTIETARNDSVRLAQAQNEDNRYRQIIALADQSFRDKLYNEAIKGYENALQIKPGETYPKKQIDLIKQLTQETVSVPVKTEKPIVAAAEPKPEPLQSQTEYTETPPTASPKILSSTEINRLYDETITRADGLFEQKDYAVSRFFYTKASDMKPAEMYPKQRIEEIGRLIDAGLSAEVRSAYDNAIKQADDAFSKNNYTVAKFYYYKALEIKSWEGYPKDRIREIQAITKTLLSELEEKIYNETVAQADEAYYTKNYSVSRFHYNKALQIKPDERYPKIKLDDIEKLIDQEKRDRSRMEYMEQVKLADQAFEQENYGVARFYYGKALLIQSNDQHSKDQLKRIEDILSKQQK